jgi:hypothetical protein
VAAATVLAEAAAAAAATGVMIIPRDIELGCRLQVQGRLQCMSRGALGVGRPLLDSLVVGDADGVGEDGVGAKGGGAEGGGEDGVGSSSEANATIHTPSAPPQAPGTTIEEDIAAAAATAAATAAAAAATAAGLGGLVASRGLLMQLQQLVQLDRASRLVGSAASISFSGNESTAGTSMDIDVSDSLLGRGVTSLFIGPPGCGKSVAAETLAYEMARPMEIISLHDLLRLGAKSGASLSSGSGGRTGGLRGGRLSAGAAAAARRSQIGGRGRVSTDADRFFSEAHTAGALVVIEGVEELFFSLLAPRGNGGGGNLGAIRSEHSKLNMLLEAVARFPGTAILHATVPKLPLPQGQLPAVLAHRLHSVVMFPAPGMMRLRRRIYTTHTHTYAHTRIHSYALSHSPTHSS